MTDICENCGRVIEVAIFRGTGCCSDDCQKALGKRSRPVTMAAVSKEELEILEKIRTEGYTLRKPKR